MWQNSCNRKWTQQAKQWRAAIIIIIIGLKIPLFSENILTLLYKENSLQCVFLAMLQ